MPSRSAAEAPEVLTFDCYGTLIDWESGILTALRPLLARHGAAASDEEILALYGRLEPEAESGGFVPYRTVLGRVVEGFGRHYGLALGGDEADALAASLPGWDPFPDTVPALQALAARYRLGVISNVDDDLFAGTASRLGIAFDWVVTAQSVGAYKPSPRMFEEALRRIRASGRQGASRGAEPLSRYRPRETSRAACGVGEPPLGSRGAGRHTPV